MFRWKMDDFRGRQGRVGSNVRASMLAAKSRFLTLPAAAFGMTWLVFVSLSFAQSGPGAAEKELFARLNKARQAQGLTALKWSDALATAARTHAGVMAQHGQAEHSFPGEPGMAARATRAGARFSSLSENVAQGPTAREIHEEFMHSPNHRANILDADVDSVGVGVVARGGQLFAVEDFCKGR